MKVGTLRCLMASQMVSDLMIDGFDIEDMGQVDQLAKDALTVAGRIIAWEGENQEADTSDEAFSR